MNVWLLACSRTISGKGASSLGMRGRFHYCISKRYEEKGQDQVCLNVYVLRRRVHFSKIVNCIQLVVEISHNTAQKPTKQESRRNCSPIAQWNTRSRPYRYSRPILLNCILAHNLASPETRRVPLRVGYPHNPITAERCRVGALCWQQNRHSLTIMFVITI